MKFQSLSSLWFERDELDNVVLSTFYPHCNNKQSTLGAKDGVLQFHAILTTLSTPYRQADRSQVRRAILAVSWVLLLAIR